MLEHFYVNKMYFIETFYLSRSLNIKCVHLFARGGDSISLSIIKVEKKSWVQRLAFDNLVLVK